MNHDRFGRPERILCAAIYVDTGKDEPERKSVTRPHITCQCGAPLNHEHRCRIDRENCRPSPVFDALFWPVAIGVVASFCAPFVLAGAAVGAPLWAWRRVRGRG